VAAGDAGGETSPKPNEGEGEQGGDASSKGQATRPNSDIDGTIETLETKMRIQENACIELKKQMKHVASLVNPLQVP